MSELDLSRHLPFDLVTEDNYADVMKNIVEPYLASHKTCGMTDGFYSELFLLENPKGTVVISYGYTEACEKYHELIYYMLKMGYQAAIQDHRGHGLSLREVSDPELVHIDDFMQYVDDLHRFITSKVLPVSGGAPLYLYGHSMGGCIAALYIEEHPHVFRAAVLSAPMMSINNGKLPEWLAMLICRCGMLLGKSKEKLFTMGSFDPDEPIENSGANSAARHTYYHNIRCLTREYQTSAATYCWSYQALRAAKRARSAAHASRITIPVLLFSATDDTYVKNRHHDIFLSHVKNGGKVNVPSRHEISRHHNDVLSAYLKTIFDFYEAN